MTLSLMPPQLRAHFEHFTRNGRWGACGECPRDGAGKTLPELCANTNRADHLLTLEMLTEKFNRERERMTEEPR